MSMDIELHNYDSYHYTAGDIVSGNIIIKNRSPIEAIGLKIYMGLECKYNVGPTSYGKNVTKKENVHLAEIGLNSALFEGSKNKSRVFSSGSHTIPFNFNSALKCDSLFSFEAANSFCRYSVMATLELKSKPTMKCKRVFEVVLLPLDNNPAAVGWQSKSKSSKMSLKKVSVEVTIPTGITSKEAVPIHIKMKSDSKDTKRIIRSKLIISTDRTNGFATKKTVNDNVEEASIPENGFIHFLKINTSIPSYSNPLVAESYKIQVEVENSKKLLNFEFPVIVGQWKNGPARKKCPFGEYVLEKESASQVATEIVTPSAPPAPSDSAIASSSPSPTTGGAPPSYQEAIQAPPLPTKSSSNNRHEFYTAKALYSFKAAHPSELSFEEGQTIKNVHESNEKGWLVGIIDGNIGLIPERYVEPVSDDVELKL